MITIRSNDSSVIRLDPNLAATVSTETFIFDNPQPLFKQVLTGLVVDYTLKRGLFLSGELLKRLKDSFLLEKQSYLELKNIVGMSIAKSGMRCRRYKNSDTRKGTLLPVFKKYWIVLNVFKLYWNQLSPKKDILDLHLEIQLGEYERLFERHVLLIFILICLLAQKLDGRTLEKTAGLTLLKTLSSLSKNLKTRMTIRTSLVSFCVH